MSAPVVTWQQLLDHCSRLHTTRTRREGPWVGAELRENSQMLDVVMPDGAPATVVPTRMHEPGFYVRSRRAGERKGYWQIRSDADLDAFRAEVEAGRITESVDGR